MKRGLAVEALQRAITVRESLAGLWSRSNCSDEYCSNEYGRLVATHQIVDAVFKAIKSELIWLTSYKPRKSS